MDHRQNVAAKFAHLAVVFLDHPDPAGDFEGTRRLFEDSYLWHRPGHRDDFLPSVIRDQKVGRRTHLRGVLRNLAQLEVRHSPIDANVSDAVEKLSLFAIPAPGAK